MKALARDLLATEGTRLQHVRTAGLVATRLSVLFEPEEAQLLIAAATLHDIGYSSGSRTPGSTPWTEVRSCVRRDTRSGWPGWWHTTPCRS